MASENQTPADGPLATAPTFELKRFEWATPERLALSGTFEGLGGAPADASPVLVVRAGERVHRLAVVPDSLDGPPVAGRVWQVQFAWQDAPVAFDVAELQLGTDLVVQLPEAGTKRPLSRRRKLEVRTAPAADGDDPPRDATGRAAEKPAEPARKDEIPNGRAATVGSQVELLAVQEELRESRVAIEQTREELARARDDLKAERERRAADSERFREGLAKVRESAERAVAVEQSAVQQFGTDLRTAQEAIAAKEAALDALRSQLEEAGAARTQAESKARAENEVLRKRVAKLETAGSKETERLRAELERNRARADAARTELETARGAVDQARSDAERLLSRLTALRTK